MSLVKTGGDSGKPVEQVLHYSIRRLKRVIIEVQESDPNPTVLFAVPRALPNEDGTVQADMETFVKLSALPEELRTQVREHLKTLAPPQSHIIVP